MLHLKDREYTARDLISTMNECSVEMAVVIGSGKTSEIAKWNSMALEAVRTYPKRLIGFVRINPLLEDCVKTVEFYIREHGFKGIKLHPMQDSYQALDPAAQRILETAAKLKVPVMIHSGTDPWTMPGQIADLADTYSEVPVIMLHSGHNQLYQHTIPSARRVNNLILETSGHPGWQIFKTAVDLLGSERLVYGSDWPCASMRAELMKIKGLPIGSKDKENILGGTIARILNLKIN
jgi:predicted TIM-barrel fold metal-dependent hydrolase